MTITPSELIVPIFAIQNNGAIYQFLGTGSFVSNPPLLITANHVINEWDEYFAISTLSNLNQLYPAKVIYKNPSKDLALLAVDGYYPSSTLKIADTPIQFNQLVANYEYGTTRSEGGKIVISPATRVGNITRTLDLSDQYKDAGKEILELSFSALKGASGSPVLSNDAKFELQGIIIANVNYHLLPAQLTSVLDHNNEIYEETSFMLPQALAVNSKHIIEILKMIT
jgi:V8-like Glu-specific endopeptidase